MKPAESSSAKGLSSRCVSPIGNQGNDNGDTRDDGFFRVDGRLRTYGLAALACVRVSLPQTNINSQFSQTSRWRNPVESNDWKTIVAEWRKLTAEEQRRIRLSRIPRKVARSMAFEGEPVDEKMLEEFLHRSTGRLPESTGTFRDSSGTADSNAAASHNREDARLIGSMTKDEDQQDDDD